ncbi:putative cobaltochelatase [Pseudonocardia hispaniensis]|uniref:Mg-protoporphyrin IX chelatase n=1 Tax=Pseudonocardia hispaniensis TaxID=904933 RepID=A0ABW1IY45_9PSEU
MTDPALQAAPHFPFSAVVGHDDLRLALLLNAVHPGVGGVLVRGEKGTAKSTAVRALAALLPELRVVPGCRFGCAPEHPDPGCPDGPHQRTDPAHPAGELRAAQLIELPVGATEDRLVGSLDLERALSEGVRAYQPGLLADAHRGVLYVDEVNLLHDHLVDLLLDAAAMGRAHVERDGVSVSHAARFLLVGTMNPEEGELRPQLLDRFGLTVEVRAARDVDTRVEVVRRRLAFEADPVGFAAAWAAAETETAERIAVAQQRIGSVRLDDRELRRIAAVCAAFDVDGMRADLVIARAAAAHAAWRGADAVAEEDVRVAARLALPHRRRRDPFDEPGIDEQALEDALRDAAEHLDPQPPDGDGGGTPGGSPGGPPEDGASSGEAPAAAPPPAPAGEPTEPGEATGQAVPAGDGPGQLAPPPANPFRTRRLEVPGIGEGVPGRRSRARTDTGRVVRPSTATPARAADVHLPATIVAAAPYQRVRGRTGPGLSLRHEDLRQAVREGREGNLVLFVVDASGSMAARTRMGAVSGAVLSLLRDAYQRRDKVGMVTFRGLGAELVLPPTSSVPAAQARLGSMRTGGRTPLASGLLRARRALAAERLRDPRRRPLLVLLTDGRATVAARAGGDPLVDACRAAGLLAADGVHSVVVDCERGPVRLGLAGRVARAAGGPLVTLDELSADSVAGVVTTAVSA